MEEKPVKMDEKPMKLEEKQPQEESNTLDPSSVIIIHPGSKYLRIGRASDPFPKRILHAIGKKRKSDKFKPVQDPWNVSKNSDVDLGIVQECRMRCISQLQKSIRSDGRKRIAPSSKKIAEMNASHKGPFINHVVGRGDRKFLKSSQTLTERWPKSSQKVD